MLQIVVAALLGFKCCLASSEQVVAWEVLNFGVLKIHPLKKWHSLLVKLKQHTEPPPTSLFLTMGCNSSKNLCTTTTVTHQTESVASAESTPIPSTNKVDLATMPTEPGEDACVDNVITSDIKVQDENPASYNDNANTLQNDKHQIELSEYIIANANDHHAATLEVPTTRSSDNTCAKIVSHCVGSISSTGSTFMGSPLPGSPVSKMSPLEDLSRDIFAFSSTKQFNSTMQQSRSFANRIKSITFILLCAFIFSASVKTFAERLLLTCDPIRASNHATGETR